jgi:chemotaxis receptor (MCP) glutamine deamidase CheD
MSRATIIVDRGKVKVSDRSILETHISSCVSICVYEPRYGIGGITHISRCRETDTTPSGKYIKKGGYYYADRAIPRLLELICRRDHSIRERCLRLVIVGGTKHEGPIMETTSELKKYEFILAGKDINQSFHRQVRFDTATGVVSVWRRAPFGEGRGTRSFCLGLAQKQGGTSRAQI